MKKIMFLNTTKLASISVGLLLVIFCTIGMSFTRVDEGGVEDANDSTSVSIPKGGPRKSHWNTGECGASDQNNNDYALTTVVTMGHGTVSIKNTTNNGSLTSTTTKTSTNAAGNEAVITWNCNKSTSGHSNSFELTANPDAEYYFAGWSTSNTSNTAASTENPWTISVTIPHGDKGTSQNGEWENSNNPYPTTYYGYFAPITYVDVTFASVPEGCSYKITVGGSTQTVSTSSVVKTHIAEAILSNPVASSGYVFAGWYQIDGSGNVVDITSASPTVKFSENVTLGARFVSKQTGQFKIGSTIYYGLKAATIAAQANDVIVQVAEETVVDGSDLLPADNGTYSIPAGVKLLVPYSSDNSFQTLPKVLTSAAALSAYRKLILMDGVNIVVNSGAQICIGGQAMAGGGGKPSGYTTGACGVLDMSRGGHLELNNGSTLYCWGFVKGQDMDQGNNTVGVGTITVNSGATVWEPFSVGDWRGGSATSSIVSTRFFPFQSYFMQNIEVPTTFWHGSSEWCYFTLNATGGPYDTQFAVIGSSNCLFKLTDAQSKVRTWYDPTTDLMCYELSGSAILDELKIKITGLPLIGTLDIKSSDFDLPITSNMHLILADCTMNLTKPLIIQPGAIIEIKNSATVTLSTNLYMYDKDDWGPWVCGKYFKATSNLTTHKNRGDGSSNSLMDDAKFIIDGSFTISSAGKLFSTAGGAALVGNGGGTLAYPSSLSGSSTLKWYKSTTTSGDGETGTVAVNNANPCNEDESYTKAIASKTFLNIHGRWFNQTDGASAINADHTYNFTYIASGAVSGTGGTDVSPNTHNAVYAPDKTGLTAGMKWCNVAHDATCTDIYNATQDLNGTPAANIRYTYQSSDWLQLLKTETEGVYGGSDNSLYALDGCTISSLGSVDENCLYTIEDVKKSLVDGHFVALEKNTNDEAFHNTANTEEYYISFAGCTWHPATKYAGEEKAYIVEGGDYIWYNNDWLLVEREDPFFFDYNDQNVKRYYEYENGEWVLADPKVRVTDAIETRDFFFLPEAFAVANGKKNATITILKDITDTTTPLSYTQTNTTCTLDLNGHTVNLTITGSGTTGVNMIKIDASGSTFTITDNSTEKDGKLILKQGITTATATKRWYGIVLANGSLALNAGEVQAINDFTYTSTKNTGMISAIYIAAGKTFTMNGGSIYAESPYYPRAIEIAGSASANATVTLNTGTITANATTVTNAMGIYTVGGTTTIKEGVTINATTKTTSAYGIYVDASTSGYWGTVNMTGGTVNATATTTTALGAFVNGTYTFNNTTPNTIKGTYRAVLSISGGSFNVETLGTTTAYGIQTRGTTTITGGTFNVTPKTTTAYGLLVQDGTTTISGTPTFTIKGTTTAYGIYANAATPDDKTGRPYNPNVIVNGGTFDVTTTTGDVAYGVYAGAGTRVITSTASDYYPGIYSSIGTVTVNGGTFNVTAKTYNAIGVYVHRVAAYESGTNTAHVFRGVANIAGGTFTVRDLTHKTTTGACDGVRSYGTLNITGGSFDVAASAATAKNATYVYGVNVYDGTATVSGTPKFTVSAYGTAFGAVANGATPDKATGLPCEADLTIDGGTFNVNTTTSTTAYGVYAAGFAPRVITSTDAGYYPGTYYSKPVATVNDGTFNVKAKTTTAIGAYCGRGVLYDQEVLEPHTVELENFGELNIKGGTFNVSTLGTTTADGVRSFGTTNITGGTFNVTPKTTTATAIRTYAGKTTITDNPHFTVKGTTKVYGLNAGCEAPNAKSGLTYNGEIECNGGTFDLETTTGATCYGVYAYAGSVEITTLHSANADYFAGNYASAGTIVVNDGIFNVKAKTTGAYGVVVPAAVSQSGATGYPTATATAKCDINGGKFLVNGTEKYAVYKKATTANFKISGGYWGGDGVNNNLAYYAVSPNKVLTLREAHALYPDGYRYVVGEGGTVTWKNGTTTLEGPTTYEKGEIPVYGGATPTKDADASYTYTHNGWTPAVSAMANSDVTYTATFSQTEKKYSVSVVAGANGSVSPASVNNIGCETASGDISATPNTGYQFAGWTLPAGVTAASGYTVNSNPIHIHATAAGTMTANFAAKTYEVTLDNQSATTAGQTNVTATYNAAMPSIAANLPAKTGYAFGGYYSEVDGGGTQYYNAGGTSAHIWDIDAATTLYAKWTQNSIGPELDIIDWTDDAVYGKTLKLNLNGIPAAGWPYEINGTSYASNQRDADRTLTIPYIGSADQSFAIVVKKTGGDVYSSHTYTIPHVDNFTGVKEYSVVYVNSGTVTVSSDATVNAVYVAPGAELVVSNGVTLTVDSIMLRTTPWEAAILDNQGTIVVPVGKAYYTRIIADNSKYYQFAIPLSSNVKNVRLSNGAKCTYNTSWMLKSYDEALRAKNGPINDVDHSNWKLLTTEDGQNKDNGVVAASKGYEMFSNTPYYREYYFPVTLPTTKTTQVAVTCTKPDGKTEQWYEANSGWNALCSPLLGKYEQNFGDHPEDGLKVSELLSDGHYWQHPSNVIYPAVPFYYQAPQTGVLHFDSKMTIANNAPRRAWNTSIPTQWMQLTIQNQYGDKLDETSIYTHPEKFVMDYETGYDVMKQSLEGGKALLYSELPCGKLAFAAVPDSLAETRIPLTVYAATEGEYIFSMVENNYLGRLQYVLLHDTQTGLVTDLLLSDFAANLTQGTNAGRFYLQCVFAADAPEVTTGVNHIKSEKDKAQKIIYNDKVYIIYQGRVYDMTGRQCELK